MSKMRLTADRFLMASLVFLAAVLALRWAEARLSRVPDGDRIVILSVGDSLPSLATDLGISATEQLTLLGVLSAECPWCRASMDWWDALCGEAIDSGWQVLLVSLSKPPATEALLERSPMTCEVITASDPTRITDGWKVTRVPFTALIDANGKVLRTWRGLVEERRYEVILRDLGLVADSVASARLQ